MAAMEKICVKAVSPYFTIAIVMIFVLYFMFIAISIFLTLHLVKDKDSKK